MGSREEAVTEQTHDPERSKREGYWPLSFTGGVSGVCVGSEREMGQAGGRLGVVMGDQRRHQKYTSQKRERRGRWYGD